VSKALGTGFRGVKPIDIEILHEDSGRPSVQISAGVLISHGLQAWQWSVSISHEAGIAVAIAVGTEKDG
jgi:holo-[acyl-carrier protein] synthase